jgi:hypothetical protein
MKEGERGRERERERERERRIGIRTSKRTYPATDAGTIATASTAAAVVECGCDRLFPNSKFYLFQLRSPRLGSFSAGCAHLFASPAFPQALSFYLCRAHLISPPRPFFASIFPITSGFDSLHLRRTSVLYILFFCFFVFFQRISQFHFSPRLRLGRARMINCCSALL